MTNQNVVHPIIMNKYKALLSHDTGKSFLTVTAKNKQRAIEMICLIEQCPKSAILKIHKMKETK